MKYKRSGNKKTNRELTIEALEILQSEGIDVSQIAPMRKVNGEKIAIKLKDVRDDRIGEILDKYKDILDPNLLIGNQIKIMRQHIDSFDEVEQKRILKLGIKKHEIPLDQKSRPFRNQIEEALYILEELKEEGIDIPMIPQTVDRKLSHLSDIESPRTMSIIKKLGLKPDYLIGSKMRTISWEYSGRKHEYHFGEKERKRVEELGFLNDTKTNIEHTLSVLEQLAELGIDISTAGSEITLEDGTTRKRYIYEIEDENIEKAIEQLKLPKYMLIGKRIDQVQYDIYRGVSEQEFRDSSRERLKKLGIMQNREEVDISKTLEVLRALEELGVNTASIPASIGQEQTKTTIGDIEIENIEEFVEQHGIQENFPLGKGITKISELYRKGTYTEKTNLTDEEKKQIQVYGLARQKEKEKTAVKDTIRLVKRLEMYGIDINTLSLRPSKNGRQTSLLLSELDLTQDQLQDIMEEFEISENFALGNRIINVQNAYKEIGRVKISEEDKRKLEKIGIVGSKRTKRKRDINPKRIDFFQLLQDAGIDVAELSATYTENNKTKSITLGMLGLPTDLLEEIAEKFEIDESFRIGGWKTNLRKAYKEGVLTAEQKEKVEGLGIISELDKLDMEQKALEAKIKEIEKFKAQVKAQAKEKNQSSIGGLDE